MDSQLGAQSKLQPDAGPSWQIGGHTGGSSKEFGNIRHQALECRIQKSFSNYEFSAGANRNDRVSLPVLRLDNAGESDDNQAAHNSLAIRETRNIAKRRACPADEIILPPLVIQPSVSPPQHLSPPLRVRMTWDGTIRTPRDTFEIPPKTQRLASATYASIVTFQATETILLAEIDSDERCTSFLRQRAPRETLMWYPGDDNSPQNQINYKLRLLDRKININKEKLAQVRERIAILGGKPSSSVFTIERGFQQNEFVTKQPDKLMPPTDDSSRQKRAITGTLESKTRTALAALVIQCAFRACRARCCLTDLLTETYQRVLNPCTNQYFYYNRITRLSQWEAPRLLRRCHCSVDAKLKLTTGPANCITISDPGLDAAAKTIQTMFRQRALRVFLKDLQLGNLEKVFDAGFGAWYYFNSRTNGSFWENVHHVRLTASNSAIYHR